MLQDFKDDLWARSSRVEWDWLAEYAELEMHFRMVPAYVYWRLGYIFNINVCVQMCVSNLS